MNTYIPIIFAVLILCGFGLLVYHITNEASGWKDYLSSTLIIIANIGMYIAIKKSDEWTKKNDKK